VKITQEQLKQLMHYDPLTGVFTWLERSVDLFPLERVWKMWNTRYSGKEAGSLDKSGYLFARIISKAYRIHRLSWLYVFNEWPIEIDHINHIKNDNRIENLRNVSRIINLQNQTMKKNNASGFNGVCFDNERKKWRVQVSVSGKSIHLGRFNDIESAIKARNEANIKYNFHSNHGL